MNVSHIYSNEIPDFISDALETPPLVRLKNVGMNCGCEYTSFPRFAGIEGYSRYEHSLGAALIVWHFTQDKVQSMAALLHDIATPVFAHVVDFLKGDYMTQEATEADTESFIRSSPELLSVLKRNGLSVEAVKDYHIYPIADNDSPKLSSDRLEYTVGNMINFGFADTKTAEEIFKNITVGDDELVFTDKNTALRFAECALLCSKIYVSDEDRYSMQILSEILNDALKSGVISYCDLGTTEPEVIGKLTANDNTAFAWMNYVNLNKTETSVFPGEGEGWRKIFAKKRRIDPYVKDLGRLSETDEAFAGRLREFTDESQDYWIRGISAK
ncbi:MAG: hypothetical protein Q4E35_06655 [Eubacteriales bacterium]|nr:hypothetical protein [Eubacteriales bacterium]